MSYQSSKKGREIDAAVSYVNEELPNVLSTLKHATESIADIKDGEKTGSLENSTSKANADFSAAIGKNCKTGLRAYYIKSIDADAKKIYLTDTKVDAVMSDEDNTDASFDAPAYEQGDLFSVIVKNTPTQRVHFHFFASVASVQNNVITYEGELPFSEIYPDSVEYSPTFFVGEKPEVGIFDVTMGMTALGEDNIAFGENSFAAGYGNIVANYGAVFGSGNMAAYAALVGGQNNKAKGNNSFIGNGFENITGVLAQCAGILGVYNEVLARSGIALGESNKVTAAYAAALNYYSLAQGVAQTVVGKYNIPDPDSAFAFIVGNGLSGNNRKNAFTVDWSGNGHFQGAVYAGGDIKLVESDTFEQRLNEKLNIGTNPSKYSRVYTIKPDGTNGYNSIHHKPQKGFIPVWDENGHLIVSQDYSKLKIDNATPKKYVDDKIGGLEIVRDISGDMFDIGIPTDRIVSGISLGSAFSPRKLSATYIGTDSLTLYLYNKEDDVSAITSEDTVNTAIAKLERRTDDIPVVDEKLDEQSFNAVSNNAVSEKFLDLDTKIGDTDAALDSILAIQNSLIGGASE